MSRGTLERYVKDISRSPEELIIVHLGRRSVLPSGLENKLLEYCIIMDQTHYGLRRQDIKRMGLQLAIRIGLKHPFNQEKSEAGKKWLRSF
jgi:hypothetical protein